MKAASSKKQPGRVRSSDEFCGLRGAAAFLEGPADSAAAAIVAGAGVLDVFANDGANDQITALQGTHHEDASTLVQQALEAIGLVDAAKCEIVMEAAFEALRVDFCTSYLVGVAVGRRLGPQSFKRNAVRR